MLLFLFSLVELLAALLGGLLGRGLGSSSLLLLLLSSLLVNLLSERTRKKEYKLILILKIKSKIIKSNK